MAIVYIIHERAVVARSSGIQLYNQDIVLHCVSTFQEEYIVELKELGKSAKQIKCKEKCKYFIMNRKIDLIFELSLIGFNLDNIRSGQIGLDNSIFITTL